MKALIELIDKDMLCESREERFNVGSIIGNLSNPASDLPIEPKSFEWKRLDSPERLAKTYEFKHKALLTAFLSELIEFQEKLGHHAKIIVEKNKVTVETFTHTVEEITELDLDLAKFTDLLYDDVQYYFLKRKSRRE